jgi:hypothetical protein
MQHSARAQSTTAGTARSAKRRSALVRALTAFLVLASMLAGVLGTARGASCPRRGLALLAPAHQPDAPRSDVVLAGHDHLPSAPDADAPAAPQGCSTAVALPTVGVVRIVVSAAHAPPLERLATLLASHDPPPLFHPPRA